MMQYEKRKRQLGVGGKEANRGKLTECTDDTLNRS